MSQDSRWGSSAGRGPRRDIETEGTALLASVPLFASAKPAHLAELSSKLALRSYRRGETIFHKDDPGFTIYIIKSGQVKITTSSPDGEEMILAVLTDTDFFGELSLLDGRPRSASAKAMQATECLTLHRDDLLDVISRHPELVGDILTALSERLRHTDLLLEDSIFLDLPARLAKRLLEMAERHGVETDDGVLIDLRLTQQDLASVVGASRVAVNRMLGLFQDKGLLRIDKQRICIRRPDDLRRQIG